MPNRCLKCGASRNYISVKGDNWECSLCSNTWSRFPRYEKLMELERRKAEVLTGTRRKFRKVRRPHVKHLEAR